MIWKECKMSEKVSITSMDFLAATNVKGLDTAIEGSGLFQKSKVRKEKEQKDEIRRVKTCCRACIANCGVIATVKNTEMGITQSISQPMKLSPNKNRSILLPSIRYTEVAIACFGDISGYSASIYGVMAYA